MITITLLKELYIKTRSSKLFKKNKHNSEIAY